MLLHVYAPVRTPWLIVEGQPSRAALDRHGTLRLEGSFQIDRLTATERRLILLEIGARSFALVPEATALRLIARTPIRQVRRRLTRWLPTRYSLVIRE